MVPRDSLVRFIGVERIACRHSIAAPVGWPRPRNAGRHRADLYPTRRSAQVEGVPEERARTGAAGSLAWDGHAARAAKDARKA